MMRCDDLRERLDDYIDNDLSRSEREQFVAHMDACTSCQRRVIRAMEIQQGLKELPVPELPADFSERQFQRFWASQPNSASPRRRTSTLWQPAMAAALLLGVLLGGGLVHWSSGGGSPAPQAVAVELNGMQDVRFAVNAKQDLSGVTLTLRLPDHVELVGYPGKKELVWTTDLKEGTNLLSLPLRAARAGSGEVVMVIDSPSGSQTQKVLRVDTGDGRTTMLSDPRATSAVI